MMIMFLVLAAIIRNRDGYWKGGGKRQRREDKESVGRRSKCAKRKSRNAVFFQCFVAPTSFLGVQNCFWHFFYSFGFFFGFRAWCHRNNKPFL